MPHITVVRVNRKGKQTGAADLYVTGPDEHGIRKLKLGMLRVVLDESDWRWLMTRAAPGPAPEPEPIDPMDEESVEATVVAIAELNIADILARLAHLEELHGANEAGWGEMGHAPCPGQDRLC
jgi:hypothetical protein